MNFRNFFLSIFLVLAVGFALAQAQDAKREPRGPKITNKVIQCLVLGPCMQPMLIDRIRSTSTSSMEMSLLAELFLACTARLSPR